MNPRRRRPAPIAGALRANTFQGNLGNPHPLPHTYARTHVRPAYVRTYVRRTYVRTYAHMCARTCAYATSPSPSPSRCVRAHARMRASCTCVCVRSQPGERERYGALSPCTCARTHGRTRTYVRMPFGLKSCPSPQPGGRSSLSSLNPIFTYVGTYVRIQSALAHWDGLSVRTCHCACHVRGTFRQALGGFNSGAAQ